MYNVTEYARDHPGGADVLLELAGADATAAYEDIGHSSDAGEIMQSFFMGVLEGAVATEAAPAPLVQTVAAVVSPTTETKQTSSVLNLRTELVGFAVGTAALVWLVQRNSTAGHPHSAVSNLSMSGPGGFMAGFLTATVSLGTAAFFAGRHFNQLTVPGVDWHKIAPHKPSASPRMAAYLPAGVLHPTEYRKFKLSRKEEVSEGIYRFTFALPAKHSMLGLPIGQHIAIRGSTADSTVMRSYTPISNNRDLGRLELIIRVYPQGQMGNYLKSLNLGDEAEIRGPKGAMKYRKGMSKSIGMIGGGTGITPLYQLVRAICEDPTDDTQISLIYGNRSESDIMLREKLEHFAKVASKKFKLLFTLDHPSDSWKGGRGYVTKDLLQERMPAPSKDTKMLLCGPPGMVNASIKNLVELGWEKPPAVGKMTDQIFCF